MNNPNPKLIALYSSVPQCGKSEVAKVLCEHGFEATKFANPLKNMIRSLLRDFGYSENEITERLEGSLKEEPIPETGGRSARYLMRTLGTEWGRQMVSDSLWVDRTLMIVEKTLKLDQKLVVDDMRFPNEYDAMCNAGFTLVRVIRPGYSAKIDHPSEGRLDEHKFHLTIINDCDITTLRDRVYDRLVLF